MKKVMFWQIGDTVVNEHLAALTFEVVGLEPQRSGNWIIMQNVHTGEFINGYEIGLQRMGYIGYRTDKMPVFA
jgi:hypothetical protein